jgi:hypothetical protein
MMRSQATQQHTCATLHHVQRAATPYHIVTAVTAVDHESELNDETAQRSELMSVLREVLQCWLSLLVCTEGVSPCLDH